MLHKLSAQVVGTVLVVAVAAADLLIVLLAGVGPGGVGATVGEHPELNSCQCLEGSNIRSPRFRQGTFCCSCRRREPLLCSSDA